MQEGEIIDEGTRGWCITRLGESIIHAGEPVDVWSMQRRRSGVVTMRYIEAIKRGVLSLN